MRESEARPVVWLGMACSQSDRVATSLSGGALR